MLIISHQKQTTKQTSDIFSFLGFHLSPRQQAPTFHFPPKIHGGVHEHARRLPRLASIATGEQFFIFYFYFFLFFIEKISFLSSN